VFYELGQKYLTDATKEGTADARTAALIRLHARAVRTATEVLRLLESGLSDGALARCRSLHEMAVVALILSKNGPEVSEQYLLHGVYHAQRTMGKLQEHAAALGWEPVTAEEMREIDKRVAELEARFGEQFVKKEYGWAMGPLNKKRDIRFADLEKAVQLEKFRPFYS
jgi:DNA-binding CsgD family transcriptional regulator